MRDTEMMGWDDEDFWGGVGGTGSLHELKSWRSNEPILVRGRPIGFCANIDQKPVYRQQCHSVRLPGSPEKTE